MEQWKCILEELVMKDPSNPFQGKKILITCHTGFKESWLSLMPERAGTNVYAYFLLPKKGSGFDVCEPAVALDQQNSDIENISHSSLYAKHINSELVFHLAAQPQNLESYGDPVGTFETNVMGMMNVLDSLRSINSVIGVIVVTTDKVYNNSEKVTGHNKDEPLCGKDLYSAGESPAEVAVTAWEELSNLEANISIVSVRARNVIGGGDVSENRLLSDLIRGFQNNEVVAIRQSDSIRPWQYVLDPLTGYLYLASKIFQGAPVSKAYNFVLDQSSRVTVAEMVGMCAEAIQWTIEWEREFQGHNARQLSNSQINRHEELIK
jgi:CDP-glucose 4,6-dehydratase